MDTKFLPQRSLQQEMMTQDIRLTIGFESILGFTPQKSFLFAGLCCISLYRHERKKNVCQNPFVFLTVTPPRRLPVSLLLPEILYIVSPHPIPQIGARRAGAAADPTNGQ